MTDGTELKDGLRERQPRGDHPAPQKLTAYHAGELPPAEVEAIQDHLALCAECTRALLALPHLYAELEATDLGERTDAGTETSWEALRARLAPELVSRGAGTQPEGAHQDTRWRRLTTSPATVYALAAGLTACLVGFPVWIALHGGAPRATPPLAVSLPGAEVTRGSAEGEPFPVHLAEGEGATLLVLPLPPGPAFASYRIEIRASGGGTRLTAITTPAAVAARAHTATDPRIVTLALVPGSLPPGDYRLRVFGLRGGRGQSLVERTLRVLAR